MNIAVSVARPLEETPGLSSTQEQERMVHTRREYNRITVTSSVICVVCIVGFVLAPLLFDAINISQLDYDSASVKIIKDKPSIIETYHQLRTNDVNRSRVGENPDSNSVCDPRNCLVFIKSGSRSHDLEEKHCPISLRSRSQRARVWSVCAVTSFTVTPHHDEIT